MGILTITVADPDADTFQTAAAHNLTNGDRVKLASATAPDGIVEGTIYFARVVSSAVFALHSTRADARNNVNRIAISSTGDAVTFQTIDPLIESSHARLSGSFGEGAAPAIISIPFSDYAVEPVYVAHSSVISTARINSDQQTLQSAYETALAVISIPFSDYNFETRYVATNSLLGAAQIEDDALTLQVSAVGLITSPTYVYTDGAPKAAPGPAIINEVWYLS